MDIDRTFTVTRREEGWRADVYLAEFLEASRTYVQKLFSAGRVKRGDTPVKAGQRLEHGWDILVSVPEPVKLSMQPVAMDLDVVYEDAHLVVINKPRGLVVHPGSGTHEPTLVHGLLARYASGGLSAIGGVERPGIVHRLDKNTSGLLVVARTDVAHRELAAQFAAAEVHKTYVAVVHGRMSDTVVDVDRPVGRDPHHRQKMAIVMDGRRAKTRIEPVASTSIGTVVLALPRTGRTHQIRVHLRSLGHPIIGDDVYGGAFSPLDGQFLHAWRLSFSHPVSEKEISLQAPLPPVLLDLLVAASDPEATRRLTAAGIF